MIEYFLGHYAYWFIVTLMMIGFYGMLMKNNLVKKLIGLVIFQTAIILFYVSSTSKWGATVPILDPNFSIENTANYINPLPHTLMLTAIVVGVATVGVAFALLLNIYKNFKSLEESELLEKMK